MSEIKDMQDTGRTELRAVPDRPAMARPHLIIDAVARFRARWDGLQRRLGIVPPQRAGDAVVCSLCGTARVQVVTASVTPVRWLSGRTRRRGYCLLDHLARYSHTAERAERAEWVWWLPALATGICWGELVDQLTDTPPGCCGCGGWRGPTQYAVWGPDDGSDEAETYCWPCFAAVRPGGWMAGCTYADLGPHYTIEDGDRLVAAAWPARQRVLPRGGGSR